LPPTLERGGFTVEERLPEEDRMPVPKFVSRRGFLATCLAVPAAAAAFLPLRRSCASTRESASPSDDHPTPRPGIDASRVPSASDLSDAKRAVTAFDEVREIPQVVDGIRCHCGCAKNANHYSLLSCFETRDAMAKDCSACRRQASYVYRLYKDGKSLDEIRAAVDERFR
jgi:hypothetical protein